MACDGKTIGNETIATRQTDTRAATEALARLIKLGKVKIQIDRATGAIALQGWTNDRARLTDACAIRLLRTNKDVQIAIRSAELRSGGAKANLGSAVHSHDGGATWDPGH